MAERTRKRDIVQFVIMLLYAILCSQLPLFNYIGYEFSVAIAIALPFIVGIPAIKLFRKHFQDKSAINVSEVWFFVRESLLRGVLLLFLPLIVGTLNMFVVKNCSYGEGILFYLLIPTVTLVWVTALALFCAVGVRHSFLLYLLILSVVFLHPLYLGYFTPQIYSYNVIYGYFPGFSYDEILRISIPLVLFRCVTLIIAVFLFLLSLLMIIRRTKDSASYSARWIIVGVLLCGTTIVSVWVFRVELGMESSTKHIQQTLGAHHQTEHFDIYYARESFTEKEIQRVGTEHEFRFHQVTTALQTPLNDRVSSYIYPDIDTKRRFIGTGNTNIAKPWRKEIHLNRDSWDDVLKHELVHVIAGEFGMPVIKAHYNIGLVEGLAMAIDPEFGNRTLPEYAKAMIQFKLGVDPVRLIKPVSFAAQASTVSYVMMGAFCKYLIEHYGIARFKDLYRGVSVDDVYGMSYEKLAEGWQHSLDSIDVPLSMRRHVEYFFRRPSIFAKECARTIADLNDRGSRYLEKKNPLAAAEVFQRALQKSWNTESYSGLVRATFGIARYDSVIQLVAAQAQDTLHRSSIINLFLLYGDALWHQREYPAAHSVYEGILSLDLLTRYNEAATIRLAALHAPHLQTTLPVYFAGVLNDTAALHLVDSLHSISTSSILQYLRAKITKRLHDYDAVIQTLDEEIEFNSSLLDAGKEQLLGEAYFMKGDYQQAKRHFKLSQSFLSNQSSVDRINDWLERCAWFENNYAQR